jgi:5-(carboxyamino)imidazole ribonucleotide synthase
VILPDATLGVLGGGQLGRMFTVAARTLGYRVWVLDPDPDSPAGALADTHLEAGYTDHGALKRLADGCAAVTTEFENVPAEALEFLEQRLPVRPGSAAVAIARDRISEKTYLREQGLATAPFFAIHNTDDIERACARLSPPALLKTARFGYDGKGQVSVHSLEEALQGFQTLNGVPCVLEERVTLKQELSVVLARGVDGESVFYPVVENVHRHGILHTSRVPAAVPAAVSGHAIEMAGRLADALDYRGVLAVEFFLTEDNALLINEMAPRPHNSGHFTLDACATSQFEQQVRALCGLPLGDTRLLSPVVMLNLLGDLWRDSEPPAWRDVFACTGARLHLYGKKTARAGRKMGHINCLAADIGQASVNADTLFLKLAGQSDK